MSFLELIEYWMKEYARNQLEATTMEDYVEELEKKILPALGHLKIAKIKPAHLQSFYNNLLEDGTVDQHNHEHICPQS